MSVALKSVPSVATASVSLNQGLAAVTLRPGNTTRTDQLRGAVTKNGFTPKEWRVTARGRLLRAGGKLQFMISGSNEALDASVPADLERFVDKAVEVEGVIAAPEKNKPAAPLEVKTMKEVSP